MASATTSSECITAATPYYSRYRVQTIVLTAHSGIVTCRLVQSCSPGESATCASCAAAELRGRAAAVQARYCGQHCWEIGAHRRRNTKQDARIYSLPLPILFVRSCCYSLPRAYARKPATMYGYTAAVSAAFRQAVYIFTE